ncbi:MAG: hypothetical protein JSR33_01080 [Proteobacteria bacterium]|nr:hypothetical protein [Pseudomonadota bacterium]
MKSTHLKSLAPVVLEEIKKIEIKKFQSPTPVESTQSLKNHTLCQFLDEACKACQRWSDESKLTFPKDILPVIDLFLIAVAELTKERLVSSTCFHQQKTLLDLVDRILTCCKNPVGIGYIQTQLTYYKILTHLFQKEKEVDTICTYIQESLTFSCESPAEQCLQIDMLDTLCVVSVAWMNDLKRELKVQDKISILASRIVFKMMDIYDGISFSLIADNWDPARIYTSLVARAVGSILRHFLEVYRDPRKDSVYRHRVESLVTRLQSFINQHAHLAPPEKEYRSAFNMITKCLKVSDSVDSWLREPMMKIAETFALQIKDESQVLAYQMIITAMRKPVMEKSSDQKIKPLSSVKPIESLPEENAKLQQQLRDIEQASIKQQRDLQAKNKLLQQRLAKGAKEKLDFQRTLTSKDSEIQDLTQKNTQLKTQLTELKDQETVLQQKQNQMSAELQQIIAAQQQQTIEYKQQASKWTQRLREQQMALHSVLAEKRRLETEVSSSQSIVQQLEEKLNQTKTQLTETQEQIERQAGDKVRDQAETYQTVQTLLGEIDRLHRLLSPQSSSMRGSNRFSFS